jgi:hypothetical protein
VDEESTKGEDSEADEDEIDDAEEEEEDGSEGSAHGMDTAEDPEAVESNDDVEELLLAVRRAIHCSGFMSMKELQWGVRWNLRKRKRCSHSCPRKRASEVRRGL